MHDANAATCGPHTDPEGESHAPLFVAQVFWAANWSSQPAVAAAVTRVAQYNPQSPAWRAPQLSRISQASLQLVEEPMKLQLGVARRAAPASARKRAHAR